MTLYEYLSLNEQEQYQAVWDKGAHVATHQKGNTIFQLYCIDSFYIEIWYDAAENKITGKNQFKQGEHLDKYIF